MNPKLRRTCILPNAFWRDRQRSHDKELVDFWKKVSESEMLMFRKKEGATSKYILPCTGPLTTWYGKTTPDLYIALPIGLRNYKTVFENYRPFRSRQMSFQIRTCRIRYFCKEPQKFPNTCLPTTNLPELEGVVRNSAMYSETQLFGIISDEYKTYVDVKRFVVSYLIPFCTSTPTHATSSTPRHAL